MAEVPKLQSRCPVTGLDLEVSVDGLLDDSAAMLLGLVLDEVAAAAEDMHRHRIDAAVIRYRRVVTLLERSAPTIARWVDARARALADLFEEVAA